MELELGLIERVSGARADVIVRAPAGTRLAAVSGALQERVLPTAAPARLLVNGRAVPPQTLLGSRPLVRGALLEVVPAGARAASSSSSAAVRASATRLTLRVVGGPDAGAVLGVELPAAPDPVPVGTDRRRWWCRRGTVASRACTGPVVAIVGRDPSCHLALTDADASRRHFQLRRVGATVLVEDLGSTNGTQVDGRPVGEGGLPLGPDALVRAGASTLQLALPEAPSPPPAPAGDGALAHQRPPRLLAEHQPVQVTVPFAPQAAERTAVPLLALLGPLVLGVAMWRLTGTVTFLLFTLLSPVLVVGQVVSERRSGRRRSRRQSVRFAVERSTADRVLSEAVRAEQVARRRTHPDPAAVLLTAAGPGARLWERRRGDDDVLQLRLGLADQAAAVEAEGDISPQTTTCRDVPVVVALAEVGVLGVQGNTAAALVRGLVVQAAVTHSPHDLQIVLLCADPSGWDWLRWLPHARARAGQDCTVLIGLGARQAAVRVAELSVVLEARAAEPAAGPQQRILLVIDGAAALRSVPGLARLLSDGHAHGLAAVCAERSAELPAECGAVAVLTGARFDLQCAGRAPVHAALADLLSPARAEAAARALSPLQDQSRDRSEGHDLPAEVRWTDLVGLPLEGTQQDAARVGEHWQRSGRSTRVPLGCRSGGTFTVDLALDGPHALVAGTTGSGKSELLQTMLASLALGNRPDELQLLLVDYKGGAAFGPCARLPHTAGVVTDLDGPLVERALHSLGAELARRERVLAAFGAKDLDEHRRRSPVALPRLVLVVDEFAALAQEVPEFVTGLIDIAMRGRSLGVHLVLATQRPQGCVSADIRANTNLRLCLAVTSGTESRDVLDSPVAATIGRAAPGRGWARTGPSELTAFQTARIGGPRLLGSQAPVLPAVAVLPADELGAPPGHTARDRVGEEPTLSDLDLLVRACRGAAARLDLPAVRPPWLPALGGLVLRDELPVATGTQPSEVPPLAFGLVDVPQQQTRRALVLDLDRASHLLIVGAPRSGRTTALRAIAAAVAAGPVDDAHLYVLDMGGGLGALADLPHTGAVVSRSEPDRVERLLGFLNGELVRRQVQLAAAGLSGLTEQRAAAEPADRLPHLVVLIDRWEAYLAAVQDVDAGRLVDAVLRLLQDGPGVGLHLVVAGDRSAAVGRLGSAIDERLVLRLAERGDYACVGVPARLVPDDLPAGCGWSTTGAVLQAQVCLLTADPAGPAQTAALLSLAADSGPRLTRPPRLVPAMPLQVLRSELIADRSRPEGSDGSDSSDGSWSATEGSTASVGPVLLGVGGHDVAPMLLDLDDWRPGLLVAGPPRSGRSTALMTLAAGLLVQGRRLGVVAPRRSPLRSLPGSVGVLTGTEEPAALRELLEQVDVLLLDDVEQLLDAPLTAGLERAVVLARDDGPMVLAAGGSAELVAAFRGLAVELRRARAGLLLCPQGPADGDLLAVRLPSLATGPAIAHPGRGLLVRDGSVVPVHVALPQTAPWPCQA